MWKKSDTEELQSHPVSSSPVDTRPDPAPRSVSTPASSAPSRDRAVIGASIQMKGDVIGEEDLHVEGQVEGTIELAQHNLSVGKSGRLKADVRAKTISIEGEVQGNMNGEEQVILRKASTVRGNILAPRVTLEDGCNFKGSIDMTVGAAKDSRPAQSSASHARVSIEEVKKSDRTAQQTSPIVSGLKT